MNKCDDHRAEQIFQEGWADLIDSGLSFVVNPDLPYRLQNGLKLREPIKKIDLTTVKKMIVISIDENETDPDSFVFSKFI